MFNNKRNETISNFKKTKLVLSFFKTTKKNMHNNAILAAVMGGTVTLGGIMGFVKRQSKISLIAGSLVGAAYGFVAYSINANNSAVEQNSLIAVGVSLLLAVGMGMRYRKVTTKEGKSGTVPLVVSVAGLAAAAGFYLMK